jgi:hypothetical protein
MEFISHEYDLIALENLRVGKSYYNVKRGYLKIKKREKKATKNDQ